MSAVTRFSPKPVHHSCVAHSQEISCHCGAVGSLMCPLILSLFSKAHLHLVRTGPLRLHQPPLRETSFKLMRKAPADRVREHAPKGLQKLAGTAMFRRAQNLPATCRQSDQNLCPQMCPLMCPLPVPTNFWPVPTNSFWTHF